MASGAPASAATYRFRILSGSQQYSIDATRGTVSGHRSFRASFTTPLPDDPGDSFTTGPGAIGLIDSTDSVTRKPQAHGQYYDNYIERSNPACFHDYGMYNGDATINMTLFDIPSDPSTVKIATSFGPPGVGDIVNGTCGGPIDVEFPFGQPASTIPAAQLFSGDPVALNVTGSQHFTEDALGDPASITVGWSVRLTVQAIGEQLRITPGVADGEDQIFPNNRWTARFPVSWEDTGCTDPREGTATPRAWLIAGPKKGPLASLLGTREEGLAGAPGFSGRALKLRQGISLVVPTTRGANGTTWQQAVDKAHATGRETTLRPGRGVFYGGRIACKLPSTPNRFTVAKSPTYVLCSNQSRLSGEAWDGLLPDMQAALGRLWAILGPKRACFALSSGFRSQKTQDGLRERWHEIADRRRGDNRSAGEISTALDRAGFAQDPAGWGRADRSGRRVARGGPATFSLHSLGIGADIHVEFSDTGSFEENIAKLRAAARQAGLCGPPASDKVHVELPYVAGRDPETGFPIVRSTVPIGGEDPKCSSFTDYPPPRPDLNAQPDQNPLNGINVNAGSPVGGTATASGSVGGTGGRRLGGSLAAASKLKSFRLKPAKRHFKAGQSVGLKLKLPRSAKQPVAAALRRGARLQARISVLVDYAGANARRSIVVPLEG
jgi:hypothetical protein